MKVSTSHQLKTVSISNLILKQMKNLLFSRCISKLYFINEASLTRTTSQKIPKIHHLRRLQYWLLRLQPLSIGGRLSINISVLFILVLFILVLFILVLFILVLLDCVFEKSRLAFLKSLDLHF